MQIDNISYTSPQGVKQIPASIAQCPRCEKFIPLTQDIYDDIQDSEVFYVERKCECGQRYGLFFTRFKGQLQSFDSEDTEP